MSDLKKDRYVNEQIKKIMYRTKYVINETPKYREITEEDFANDDVIPATITKKAEILNDANLKEDDVISGNTETNIPSPDINQSQVEVPEEKNVDEIQNEIIKLNLQAMHQIYDKLAELDGFVKDLNQNMTVLKQDVEEVREPSTTEKLMSKKDSSYPFYYNLNDYWKGSSFEAKRESQNEKGMKQLPDGTFIADFDDLPQYSDYDINNSFEDRDTYVY